MGRNRDTQWLHVFRELTGCQQTPGFGASHVHSQIIIIKMGNILNKILKIIIFKVYIKTNFNF